MKLTRKILIGLLIVLALIQFIRIDKTNPETVAKDQFHAVEEAPDEVAGIMKRACFDCHSNHTKWPWYSNVAPLSWFVGKHVREGREELNFSEWASYDSKRRHHKLEECMEEVGEGEMPLKGYVVWHDEALISPEDTATLFPYFRKLMKKYDE
mgnify:CR=1 FL=1